MKDYRITGRIYDGKQGSKFIWNVITYLDSIKGDYLVHRANV